jgi:hypothetical protein
MFFRKGKFGLAMIIGAIIFAACSSSDVDSENAQHPGEGVTHLVSFDTLGA